MRTYEMDGERCETGVLLPFFDPNRVTPWSKYIIFIAAFAVAAGDGQAGEIPWLSLRTVITLYPVSIRRTSRIILPLVKSQKAIFVVFI